MRPKHMLWLAAAVLCTTWLAVDPQARFGADRTQASRPTGPAPVALGMQANPRQDKRITAGL
jgi:hypothetical protein